ncbi:MAG: HEAT repeat domain-containing protein [Vicinamibacteria bacterium]|nr:HEAT repeat domain-containing protein [Vicinamibacteria bacterium]
MTSNNSRNRRTAVILPALLLVLASPSANAEDLSSQVERAVKAGTSTWLTWRVPSAADGIACCWNGKGSGESKTCSLESDSYGMNMSRDRDGTPQIDTGLMVYAHLASGGVDKIRIFSNSCRVETGNENVRAIAGVAAAESVAYLETLVDRSDEGRAAKRRSDGALMAIALHDEGSADRVLEHVARDSDTKSLRESAAFWLGSTRERPGYEALVRLRSSDDARFRQHLTFAFSQSKVAEAKATLIDMARNDPSGKVRSQALFWIAQKAQKRADADVIRSAVDDPDAEVKKQAVFALSQIPNGEGVPDLIRVARENKSREVRKQAMFWLGQSKDPRAMAFFEKILSQ